MAEKPAYRAWFESFHDPSERYELDEVVYSARDGGLLQVVHDMDELGKTPAKEWKELFESLLCVVAHVVTGSSCAEGDSSRPRPCGAATTRSRRPRVGASISRALRSDAAAAALIRSNVARRSSALAGGP